MSNNLFGPDGAVYLIQYGDELIYKIGSTTRMSKRFCQLKISVPHDIKLIHTISTDDHKWLERYWHDQFRTKRIKGSGTVRMSEWFELTKKDVEEFESYKEPIYKPNHIPDNSINLFMDHKLTENDQIQFALDTVTSYFDRLIKANPRMTKDLANACAWQLKVMDEKITRSQQNDLSFEDAIEKWKKEAKKSADKKVEG